MNEERRQILEMLAEGKISAEEAEQLIAALDQQDTAPPDGQSVPRRLKYLRVLVDSQDEEADGPTHVNIRVPLQLLRAGVNLTRLIPHQALDKADEKLRSSGVPIDLSKVKPEEIDELVEHLRDLSIDVDEGRGKTKVRVFCE